MSMVPKVIFWLKQLTSRLALLTSAIGGLNLFSSLIALFSLIWVCQEIFKQKVIKSDISILLIVQNWVNPVLDTLMTMFSRLGYFDISAFVVILSVLIFWSKKQYYEAKWTAFVNVGALIITQKLKLSFARPRPQFWTSLPFDNSYSFPSGHALGSVVIYGFLAYVIAQKVPKFSSLIYGVAVGIAFMTGFSRIYLAEHWPSDVIAGYAVGFLWLMICIIIMKLQRLFVNKD